MTPLSAIDAISPAFTRTHDILFRPFRLGRSWKLAFCAYLGFGGSVFFPVPFIFLVLYRIPGVDAPFRQIILALGIVYSVVFLAVYYFAARMSLVSFEMVVTRQKFIAPMWRRYGLRVWPWIGLKVVVGTVLSAAMTPLVIAGGRNMIDFFHTVPRVTPGTPPDFAFMANIYGHLFGFYGALFAFFLILKFASTLLDDFVKPFFLLEPISLSEALSRGFKVLVADPLRCLLYLFLKYLLAGIGYMMQSVAMQVCFIPIFLLFGGIAFAGWAALHHAGPAGTLAMVAGAVVLGLTFMVVTFYLTIGAIGYLIMLLDAYAVYFLGGSYPLLGDLLEAGVDRPFTPPPVFPSDDERRDDDGGPPMPMNPAVA